MKKLSLLITLLAVMITGASCSKGGGKNFVTDGNSKFAVVLFRGDDNWIDLMYRDMEKYANERNIKLTKIDSNNNQELQFQQVKDLASKSIDGVLMNVVETRSDVGMSIIQTLKERNIPIVFFNRHPGEKVIQSYDKAYYVGTIPAQSGVMQGLLIIDNWLKNPSWDRNGDKSIQYVILKGTVGNPDAEERTKWAAATIKNYPRHNVKAEELDIKVGDWQTNQAKKIVSDWLDGPVGDKMEVIIANNDAMAIGAVQALEARGKKIPVFGVDAIDDALQLIKQGKMAGTIKQDDVKQSESAINLAYNASRHLPLETNAEFPLIEKNLMVPYIRIDQSNIDQYLTKK